MPRIDPLKLLTCLGVLLAPNGGIRSSDEVKRLAGLMAKFSKKLVSKCIYIQILKCTETKLLGEFMAAGGWSLSHMWLTDGILSKNWPLVQELLELLLCCPVDVTRLKSNSSPKLVKGLSKDGGHEGVRILATKLVEQWLKIVKGETMTPVEQPTASGPTPTTIDQEKSFTVNNNKISHPTSNSLENTDNSELTDNSTNGLDEKPENELEDLSETLGNNVDESDSSVQTKDVKSNEALVFKITVKDGKQVLKKVESSPLKTNSKNSADNSLDNVKNTNGDLNVKIKERTLSTSSKDSSSDKNKNRDKSRDKDSDRHKKSSSSSSSRRSSSSKTSSSRSHNSSSKSNSSSSSSKSSSRDKDRERDKDRSRDKERSSKSSSSKSSSKSSSSNKDSHRDKEKENEKSKVSQAAKDKDTLAKVMPPSIDKLGKIPKKPKDESSAATATAKKASISIEVRNNAESRPKTVKLFNSQFRSHGLAEEAPPPPSRKGLIKPANTSTPGTAIPSSLPTKRMSPPPSYKDAPPEKKTKLESPVLEKPRSIKLIEPKPKPSLLVESDLFMASLNTDTSSKPTTKKRKRTVSVSTKTPTPTTETSPLSSPAITKPPSPKHVAAAPPLKFYQDTLEDNEDKDEEKKVDKTEEKIDIVEIKEIDEEVDETSEKKSKSEETDDVILIPEDIPVIEIIDVKDPEEALESVLAKPPGPGCGPDGPPGVLTIHRKKGPKKQLKWRPAEELEEIRYFELDENERVNVTKTFTEQKQLDRIGERESFMMARKLVSDDLMQEQTMWMPLIEMEGIPPHPNGKESKEFNIQLDRQRSVLQALYFNRLMIPDHPAEPDLEQYQVTTDPQVIPLEDITGNPDAVNDFTHMIWPDSRGSPPPSMSMNGPIPFIPPMGAPQQGLWRGPGNGPPGTGPNNMWNGPPMNVPMGPGGPPMGNFGNMIMPGPEVGNGPMANFPNRPPNGFNNGFNGPPGMNDNRNRNFGPGPNMEFFRPNGPVPNGPPPPQNWTGNSRWNNRDDRGGQAGQRWNPRNICKSFQNTGACRNIDRCNFLHPGYNCPPF